MSTKPTLPAILTIINPPGEGGAVAGFGAPLRSDAGKDALGQPITRGGYAIASKDRKSVIKMLVFSKEEVGFDPEAVARHSEQLGVSGDLLTRIRATWSIAQLRFESHDPDVYPSLDFILAFAARFGSLTDAAVADPVSERYVLPEDLFAKPRVNALVDAREHIAIKVDASPAGLHIYSRGLQKFALPELEITGAEPGSEAAASNFILATTQRILEGNLLKEGQRLGRFNVAAGGLDPRLWEGIPCLELRPPPSMSVAEALG